MENYDFSKKADIDAWYVGAVEQAVKTPLRTHLLNEPNVSKTRLLLTYGLTLSGITGVRNELYRLAKIRIDSSCLRLEDILNEIRGIE